MDEMLTLRILTMTDDEKTAMSSVDRRTHALLARTESLGGRDRMRLHGVLRAGWATKEGADVQPGTGI
jgi:hydrogenase maturation protease